MKKLFYGLAAFAVGLIAFLLYYYVISDNTENLSDIDKENARRDSIANLPDGMTPDEKEAATRKEEETAVLEYLELNEEGKETRIRRRKLDVTISIANNAKYTSYKEMIVELVYLDEDGKKLGSATEIIYDILGPEQKEFFDIEKKVPEATSNYTLALTEAKVVEEAE